MMKVSDYIASFLAELGIKHVFAITGGASIHMIHSIAERNDISYVCPHHEQAGAMAADAYSRVSGRLGCAIATSGPGATNLITGICCSWFDSVPVLYLTGQVARFRFKGTTGVRQMGFQETDIVSMVRPVTKYAVMVTKTEDLRYEMEKAVHIACSGRPGPVLVDVPDDLQRELIDVATLRPFVADIPTGRTQRAPASRDVIRCRQLFAAAKRPVVILGAGVRLSGAAASVIKFLERLGAPVCPSWAAADMVPSDHPLLAGTFGTHGTRAGNFTVQNADLVLAIGARLSTRETGSPLNSWARGARTIIVDIDSAELAKFPSFDKQLELAIEADAAAFMDALLAATEGEATPDRKDWVARVADWRRRYPPCLSSYREETAVNPYVFVDELSCQMSAGDVIVSDTGCAVAWLMQGFRFRDRQRLLHAFNNTPMGYGLPAAVGAAFALGGRQQVVCITGDGSTMMNLQELATIRHHALPIKVFLINNGGYSMVQQTQEQWLDGHYFASSIGPEGGLSFPDFNKVADAFGIDSFSVSMNSMVHQAVARALATPGPVVCNVQIPSDARVIPQCKFGYPIEDSEPLLPREEFLANMLVEPMPISRKGALK